MIKFCLLIITAYYFNAQLFGQNKIKKDTMIESYYELPRKCNFEDLLNGSNAKNTCVPKLNAVKADLFRGILINAPVQVVWPRNLSLEDFQVSPLGQTQGPLRLMLTGFIQTHYSYLDLNGSFGNNIKIVATDIKTGVTYEGQMPQGSITWMPQPQSSPEELKEIKNYHEVKKMEIIKDYFTLDLVHDLGLPIKDAEYKVHAVLGEYQSNFLTIKASVN